MVVLPCASGEPHPYPHQMLCCIGDLVEDVVVWPSAIPRRGTDTASRVFRRRGGSAANVATLAVRAGGRSRFIGQVGRDRLGQALVAELQDAGVDVAVIHEGTTGSIVVLVEPDGERTMLADRGAATRLKTIPPGALDDAAWLHVPAYSLIAEPLGATTRRLLALAHADSIPISVDASSTGPVAEFGIEAFVHFAATTRPDVLLCNAEEAGLLGVGRNSPLRGAGLCVVKAGPDPVLLIEPDGTTTEVIVPPVDKVIDTTGAGDAFAAGFLVARIEGASWPEAAAAGNRLAATVLTSPGAGDDAHP